MSPRNAISLREEKNAPLGAFLGSDGAGVDRIAPFEKWLGSTVTVGHTYLPGERWPAIEGGNGFLDPWARWRTADRNRMFVLNVPMITPNEDGLNDEVVSSLLRGGAAGAFDRHFAALAANLVKAGLNDTIIVPGWEMNGATYNSRCRPNPEAWKLYWRRIVTLMRAVPGARFRFDYTANRGRDAVAWPDCYPGDDVVDIIGLDSYDQPAGADFATFISEPNGLQAQADFAKEHGKPISFPEWGLFRNGDNPAFIQGMHDWIVTHDVVYQTITDYCPHGVWRCSGNPDSSSLYRRLFSGVVIPPAPPVTQTPAPSPETPTTPPPASTAPSPGAPNPGMPNPGTPGPAAPGPGAPAPASSGPPAAGPVSPSPAPAGPSSPPPAEPPAPAPSPSPSPAPQPASPAPSPGAGAGSPSPGPAEQKTPLAPGSGTPPPGARVLARATRL
ncbi:glycoside hydrolase family 26 protein [Actinomadura macrotermitis]|nr:glycosyl hydrolase [Actinomadura macrotermitis]